MLKGNSAPDSPCSVPCSARRISLLPIHSNIHMHMGHSSVSTFHCIDKFFSTQGQGAPPFKICMLQIHICTAAANIHVSVTYWLTSTVSYAQSMLRPPEVHMFYRKIEVCIACMGDNDMHATCTHKQKMVDHVIPELQEKVSDCCNWGTIGQNIC